MATASAKAMPRIMFVWMVGVASGLRPMACTAPPETMPMPAPAPMAPIMARPAPRKRIACRKVAGSFMARNPPSVWVTELVSGRCGVLVVVAAMADGGLADEHQGQHAKNIGLDHTDEQFKHIQEAGNNGHRERAQDREQQGAGEN